MPSVQNTAQFTVNTEHFNYKDLFREAAAR